MAAQGNNVGFTAASSGTVDYVYSSTISQYQAPADANLTSGLTYEMEARDSSGNWEIVRGVLTISAGPTYTFARTTVLYNSAKTGTQTPGQSGAGTKINFATPPSVFVTLIKESLIAVDEANNFTAAQRKQACANISANKGYFQVDLGGTNATGLTANANNKIPFSNKQVDSQSWFDATTNHRFQPTEPGIYLIGLNVAAACGANGTPQPIIMKNGVTTVAQGLYFGGVTTNNAWVNVSTFVQLNGSTDYIEGFSYLSGGVTTINGGTDNTFLFGYKVGE